MAKSKQGEMSFLDHLEALRWMLIRTTVVIIVLSCISYFFIDFIFDVIIFGPKDPNFITYHFFCYMTQLVGEDSISSCATEFSFDIINTSVDGQFSMFMWTCITAGFIASVPYILYEVWKFIKPALYEKERRNALAFIVVTSLLFFLGVLFGYFIVIPLSVSFFGTFSVSSMIENKFTMESYISMIKTSAIVSGLVFEVPVIIYFLTKLRLITPAFLRKYRRVAIVIILIVAAIVTPPEITSQVITSIPILILYEVSILISASVHKRQLKEDLIRNEELNK